MLTSVSLETTNRAAYVQPREFILGRSSRLRGNDAELNAAVDLNKVADLSKEAGL